MLPIESISPCQKTRRSKLCCYIAVSSTAVVCLPLLPVLSIRGAIPAQVAPVTVLGWPQECILQTEKLLELYVNFF